MKWRWRLGELFGIVIYMHVTFLLLIAWFAFVPLAGGGGWKGAAYGVAFILLLFACVVMHEYGHALTARRFGISTRDITLLPIGGVSSLERMPREPSQELAVALAGPAVNVLLAAVLAGLIYLTGGSASLTNVRMDGAHLLNDLWSMNVILAIFNLVPAFPMDGGRVLRAVLARRMPYERATRLAASLGQLMAFVFAFVGLFQDWFLLFIALFVYMGAEAEAQSVQVQALFRGLPVGRVMVSRFASLSPEEPLSRAVQLLLSGTQQDFPVKEGDTVVGMLTRRDLLASLHELGPQAPVASALRREVAPVEASVPLDEIFQRMQADNLPVVPVTREGHLMGLLTMENIAEFLMVTEAMEGAPAAPRRVPGGSGAAVERPAERGAAPGRWQRQRGEQI
jgi:Zn-dependent protease/CBS domain-containing protein